MFNQHTNPTHSTTGVTALAFFNARTRFEKEEIANSLLGGFGFDAGEWVDFIGSVSSKWVDDLRSTATAWEHGY